jgi:N-acetylglucosaminyldiphosphoundecaprenol N-acetyl-beta-D-mannosaminyltransferase
VQPYSGDAALRYEQQIGAHRPIVKKSAPIASTDILGVKVSSVTLNGAADTIEGWIRARRHTYVCVSGVHGVMESRYDRTLRRVHNDAGLVTPDGMPLVWLSRLYGRTAVQRVCGRELMRRVTALSARSGYRQFYYGGADGVADKLANTLQAQYPGLQVAGTFCPPFRALTREEDASVIATINAARVDVLWVGLSTPKQELWMAAHLHKIDAPVMIGVGAAFDFLTGAVPEAPKWMQRSGLEWLFRLWSEPRRLWRRYGYIVPSFIALAALEVAQRAIVQVASPLWAKLYR